MIVAPNNKAENVLLAQWAANILDESLEMFGFDRYGDPLFQTLGFKVKDEMACVVVIYHYCKPNIAMAFASKNPRWATKGNLRALGQWVFEDLDCGRITAFVKKSNKRARKFDEGVGFKHEGKLRKASGSEDVIIYGLLKEDHEEWLRKAYGKEGFDSGSSTRSV